MNALHGARLELFKEPRQRELERDIVSVLLDNYETEFGEPAQSLLDAALELMPSTVPADRQEALLEQMQDLAAAVELRETNATILEGIAAESYTRERNRTGFMLGQFSDELAFTVTDDAAVAWLGQETPFWIGKHYSKDLSGIIRRIALEQGFEEG